VTPGPVPIPEVPAGLLLGRDLIFTTKVVGTASALGLKVISAGDPGAVSSLLASWTPSAVFVDLAAGELASPASLAAFRAACPGIPFIAFGSHVDTAVLLAAREAGCEEVMPRSRFAAELPELLRRYVPSSS
jgi:hypothetical protein